jgi:hypothetical protein
MSGTLNWNDLMKDAEANGGGGDFSPLPNGDYDCKIIEASSKPTSTGKPMIKVKAEVQTGQYAKRLLWDNLVISTDSPKAMSFFFRKMKALGLDEQYFASNPSVDQIAQAMENRQFKGRIKQSTYKDKAGNEFEGYAPAGASTTGPTFTSAPAAPQAAPAPAPAAAPAPAPAAPQAAPQAAPAAPENPWANTAPAAPENPWANTAPAAPQGGPAAPPAPPF